MGGSHMSTDPTPDDRVGKKVTQRVEELERVVKALITGMKETEKETGEPLMPTGEYYGIKFD
jgi:hypothetical protein